MLQPNNIKRVLPELYTPTYAYDKDKEFESLIIPINTKIQTIYDKYIDEEYAELNFE